MTAPHLLSLADLHAAALGVLDVVFGPDGDFEGAPRFAGPVFAFAQWWTLDCTTVNVHERGDHHVLACNGWATSLDECYLDLRVSTVAARLAGLCARAMGDGASMYDLGTVHCGFLAAQYGMDVESARRLAVLTLALAPRIAALRKTRPSPTCCLPRDCASMRCARWPWRSHRESLN